MKDVVLAFLLDGSQEGSQEGSPKKEDLKRDLWGDIVLGGAGGNDNLIDLRVEQGFSNPFWRGNVSDGIRAFMVT